MVKGDKVRILSGFYLGMEGYIEDFKDGQCIVALKNDNGYVNTMMYPKRLELVEEENIIMPLHMKSHILRHINEACNILEELDGCINSFH